MAGHDQQIHLPPPSLSPVTIAIGATFIAFGVLYGIVLIVIGGVFLLAGIATWLIDDARAYAQAPDAEPHVDGHH